MKCLIFAHRGEAQEFIKRLKLKTTDQLYYSNDGEYSLIISGEGPYEVLTKLPYLVAKHDITSFINYGIAGSLTKNLELNKIYPIRTAYAHDSTDPLFHSYQSELTEKSTIDCITTFKRVLTDDFADDLSGFSQIVDRELWAVGKVAKQYKIPFQAYKLISDYAGNSTQCFDLTARAQEFSQKLWEHFSNAEFSSSDPKCIETFNEERRFNFKTSFTQKKLIENLLEKVDEQNLEEKLNPIDANDFIEKLRNILNPVRESISKELAILNRPFNDIGASLEFDKSLEKESFKISMIINSQKNLENLESVISKMKFSDFQDLLNGNIDV